MRSVRAIGVVLTVLALAATPAPADQGRPVAAGRAPASQMLELVLPLAADDSGLSRFALAVSTPDSPAYGHYASIATLARRFGAHAAVVARVIRYLRGLGAREVSEDSTAMFVNADMTVAQAERTFATSLGRFRAADGSLFVAPIPTAHAASSGGSLPPALRRLVLGVIGLDTEPVVSDDGAAAARHRRPAADRPSEYARLTGNPSGCRGARTTDAFTPNQYRTAYDLDPLWATGLRGHGLTVAVVEIHSFRLGDLQTFARCFGLRLPPISIHRVGFRGPLPQGGEPTLDLELLDAVAPGLDGIQDYESSGASFQSLFASFHAAITARSDRPQLISSSLGDCEADVRAGLGAAGLIATDRDFELAAASGITVASGSGDLGSSDCAANDGDPLHRLATDYPGTSQWVTSVGGTQFVLGMSNHIKQQVVWNDTFEQAAAGGGGFSSLFARPSYQDGIVSRNRRAVPDVSAMADVSPGYAVYCTARTADCENGSGWQAGGGTSASAPVVVAGLALVDDDLHRHGQSDLGFVNPLIYKLGAKPASRAGAFYDVTQGNNDLGPFTPHSNRRPLACCTAAPGFDEATGWGSIRFGAFDDQARAKLPR